ncbi:hypothetical protein V8B97DRAFT_1963802, partial [Scleroderma yunnanense]
MIVPCMMAFSSSVKCFLFHIVSVVYVFQVQSHISEMTLKFENAKHISFSLLSFFSIHIFVISVV